MLKSILSTIVPDQMHQGSASYVRSLDATHLAILFNLVSLCAFNPTMPGPIVRKSLNNITLIMYLDMLRSFFSEKDQLMHLENIQRYCLMAVCSFLTEF